MNTQRLGEVYHGQWAIHTHTGQIGQIIGWDDNKIKFKTWGGTRGTGDDSGRGFINADDKDMFRAATGYEIRGYVNGDWGWAPTEGQSLTGVEDPRTIQTPHVKILEGIIAGASPTLPSGESAPLIEKIVDSPQVEESSSQLLNKIELQGSNELLPLLELFKAVLTKLDSIEKKLDSIFK